MSTRGRIGVLRPDGRVESIYNHYDSYLEGLGEALKKINNPKLVDELIALGNRKGTYADEDWHDKDSLFNEPSRFFDSEDDFYNNGDDWSDYRYLFKNGKWNVSVPDGWSRKVVPLIEPDPNDPRNQPKPTVAKNPLDLSNRFLGDR